MNRAATCLALLMFAMVPLGRPLPGRIYGISGKGFSGPGPSGELRTAQKAKVTESFLSLPLSFEANVGQADKEVKFLARGSGYTLFMTRSRVCLRLGQSTSKSTGRHNPPGYDKPDSWNPARSEFVSIKLLGSNPSPEIDGVEPLPGKSNYFIGNDPAKWHVGVPSYSKLRYRDVYPGVDWVHYGNQSQFEHDFVVRPGADPEVIRIAVEGSDHISLDESGGLILRAGSGEIRLQRPDIYQEASGIRTAVSGEYVVKPGSEIGFKVASHDPRLPLVIDPVLKYTTHLGGIVTETGRGIDIDDSGNVYAIGETESVDFPVLAPLQTYQGEQDIFVTKFDQKGSEILYSTYVGGFLNDWASAIAVDSEGNAYVAGYTESDRFPLLKPLQPTFGGLEDAVVFKLNTAGDAFVYSTYLGGKGMDRARGIAVDSAGNAFAAGETVSPDFPTEEAIQPALHGFSQDGFLAKINSGGSALIYSTYLGGSEEDAATSVAVDPSGAAYLTGYSRSVDFRTVSAFQRENAGGRDAFVAKLSADGQDLIFSTYLGGTNNDYAVGLSIDRIGNVYVAGVTGGGGFPLVNEFQRRQGFDEAFVTKLNPAGSDVLFSTYLGGASDDWISSMAVDPSGNIYVVGGTCSTDFAQVTPSDPNPVGAFVAKLNADVSSLGYFFGLGDCTPYKVIVNSSGSAYVTGSTLWGWDAFVTKVTEGAELNFAQFANGESWVSSILLTNPSTIETAEGSVSLLDDMGQPMPVSLNGQQASSTAPFVIRPLGSVTFTSDGAGKLSSGSAHVTCATPVAGVLRFSYPGLGVASVGESQPLARMIMPVVRDAAQGLSTGVAVDNSTPGKAASVSFVLRGLDGKSVSTGAPVDLPANAHLARFMEQLFPAVDTTDFLGTLVITAYTEGGSVAATALQVGASPGQFTTLPVVPIDPAPTTKELTFAQFANGTGWITSLFLTNPLAKAVTGELSFFDRNGARLALPLNGRPASDRVNFSIQPFGGAVFSTDGTGDLVSGSARVTADSPIGGVLRFASPTLGIAGVGASKLLSGFITPAIRSESKGMSTGVAITSPSAPANLTLTLRDPDGLPVAGGQTTLKLAADGQVARFIEELFPDAETSEFSGTLTVVAETGLIAGTALQTGSKPGELTTMPVAILR
jgi:hypothetical protein